MSDSAVAHRVDFGKLTDGTTIESVDLANGAGMSVRIITLGAAIQSLSVPDRNGHGADVVLGYATAAEYAHRTQYLGATVGRYANRIAAGRFTLGGKQYQVATNDGPNHLHGGWKGLDKVVWRIEATSNGSPARVVLTHTSLDGDGGYPGELKISATYSLGERNELAIEYRATTDRPTIVNITNHSYFNLAGVTDNVDVMSQRLTLFADAYTPVDSTLIPTGERRNVAGTVFDFRRPEAIGRRIRDGSDDQVRFGRGYDHNFILNGVTGTLRMAARLEDPASGRVMDMLTTAPGLQFYSGNFLDGTVAGKGNRVYRQGDALCLEPQVFPDAPNHADFPSARLEPGQVYLNRIVLRFSTK